MSSECNSSVSPQAAAPERFTILGLDARTIFLCSLILVMLLRLQAVWPIGFYQDDAVVSSWRYEGFLAGRTIFGQCHQIFKTMAAYQGRIVPVAAYVLGPLDLAIGDNLVLYRSVQAAFQALALGAFALLLSRLNRDHWFWGAVLAVFAAIYEVREYHDAAYGQFAALPFIILLGSLAGFFALRCAADTTHPVNRDLWLVLVFNALAILTMEIAIPFCLIASFLLLATGAAWRVRLVRAVAAGLPVCVVMIIDAVLKRGSVYPGTTLGRLDLQSILPTYRDQLVSALPLSYLHYDPQQLFHGAWYRSGDSLAAIAIGVALSLVLFIGLQTAQLRRHRLLLIMGATLFFIPSLLISVSLKYQNATSPGLGYLQTMFSYLGSSVLLVTALVWLNGALRRFARPLAIAAMAAEAVGIGLIGSVSLLAANRVAQEVNAGWRYPREMTEVWMHATKPAAGTRELVVVDHDWLNRWETNYYLYEHRGSLGSFMTRRDFENGKPSVPGGTTLIHLRYPTRADPRDLFFVLASFMETASPQTGSRLSAFVICADRSKLQQSSLRLRKGGTTWDLPSEVRTGYRGYYYRQLDIATESPAIDPYDLALR